MKNYRKTFSEIDDNTIKIYIDKVIAERNEALFSLDEKKIKAYIQKYGLKVSENPVAFWGAIYKAIYNIPEAPQELKQKAKTWLDEHGMSVSIF